MKLSSFEAELDGITSAMKSIARITNILDELGINRGESALLYNDNKSTIDFVHGEGVAKGVRHMELRMWYSREEYRKGKVVLDYMPGVEIPSDKLTKLGNVTEHKVFVRDILGLNLINFEY